jgi:hypothetical protein
MSVSYVDTAARVSTRSQLDPSPNATTGLPAAPSETYINVPVSTVGNVDTVYVGSGIPKVLFAAVADLSLRTVLLSYTVPTSSPDKEDAGISMSMGFAMAGFVI